MSMTQQIHKKRRAKKDIKISPELQNALDELSLDFEKLRPKVDRVFEIGRLDGLGDMQIGKLVRKKMKEHYSLDTITDVLRNYPEAIYKNNVRPNAFDNQNVGVSPTNGDKKDDTERENQGIGTKDTEPNAIFYFKAEDFNINEVTEKDRNYLIDALEHWYTEANKWKAKYEELAKSQGKKPKKTQGTIEDKMNLLKKGLAHMYENRESDKTQ